MRYQLSPNNTLLLRGPSSATLVSGRATILGGPLPPYQKRIVSKLRQLPFETETNAELEVVLGKSGEIFQLEGSTIPGSWGLAASALEKMQAGRVIILGPADVGKSTLCVYLVNKLKQGSRKLRVVDADIGQTDLGPATTIARASPVQFIASLTELEPDALLFIGHTSPGYVERKLIDGIKRLSANSEESLTIINTDGWITEPGAIRFKIRLITELNPTLLLGLGFGDELQPILGSVDAPTLMAEPAKAVLTRSRAERRNIRENGYRRFLDRGVRSVVPLEKVHFSYPKHFPPLNATNRLALHNLIVGILNDAGYLMQIGILLDVDRDSVHLYSRQADDIHRIELGCIKLTTSGREIGFL